MVNRKRPETIIKGPAGRLVNWDIKIPKIAQSIPKREEINLKDFKFLLKFLEEAAGRAVKPATNNPPTNFTPKATTAEIERR